MANSTKEQMMRQYGRENRLGARLGNNILDSVSGHSQTGLEYIQDAMKIAFPLGTPPERRFMVTLHGYFDESGIHGGSQAVTVAGFLAQAHEWVEFSAQWQLALDEFGVDAFHMADFANMAPPFDGWPEPLRRRRPARLLTIIEQNTIASAGTTVDREMFEDVFSERARRLCSDAYGLAAIATFMGIGIRLRHYMSDGSPPVDVSYVFEANALKKGSLIRAFDYNRTDPEQRKWLRAVSLRFEDKRLFLPLQGVDILAYELYRESLRFQGRTERGVRYPITALGKRPHHWGVLDEETLRNFSHVLEIRADMEESGELKPL